jgi:sRNA-binding protein
MNDRLPAATLGDSTSNPALEPSSQLASDEPVDRPQPQATEHSLPGEPELSAPPGLEAERVRVPDLSLAECSQALKDRFPALFGGPAKPLKLRIQADIQARAPGVFNRKSLSVFLHRHTTSTGYLIALTQSGQRFDLDGEPAGEVSEEHQRVAQEELQRRRAISQEKRAAFAKAQADARLEARKAQRDQERQAQQQKKAQDDAMHERMRLLRAFESTTLTRANFCALKGVREAELDALLAQARQDAAAWAQREPRAPRTEDARGGRNAAPGGRRPDDRGPRPPRRDGAHRPARGGRPSGKPTQG